MAQKRRTLAVNTAQLLGTTPEHKRMKPRAIIVNDKAAGAKTLTFTDVFTTSTSAGATTTTVTNTWLTIPLPGSGVLINLGKSDLAGIELLGAVYVTSDTVDATSSVTVAWDLE